MAVRREVFQDCQVVDYWTGALSDDYAISRAIHDHSRTIRFQPRCLSFSHEDCRLHELLEWSGRQLSITHIYHPKLWRLAFASQALNSLTRWHGFPVDGALEPDPRVQSFAVCTGCGACLGVHTRLSQGLDSSAGCNTAVSGAGRCFAEASPGLYVLGTSGFAHFLAGIHPLSVEPNHRMAGGTVSDGLAHKNRGVGRS